MTISLSGDKWCISQSKWCFLWLFDHHHLLFYNKRVGIPASTQHWYLHKRGPWALSSEIMSSFQLKLPRGWYLDFNIYPSGRILITCLPHIGIQNELSNYFMIPDSDDCHHDNIINKGNTRIYHAVIAARSPRILIINYCENRCNPC